MADVDTGGGGGAKGKHGGGPKQKKKSTKVDMTAMVDVAFLLLTFFILTTTMATPQAMEVNKPPKDDKEPPEIAESKILMMVLGEKDQIYHWQGTKEPVIKTALFSEIRDVINGHLNKFPNRCKPGEDFKTIRCWDPIFVIKPSKTCRYKNLVDILDEMKISGAKKYALGDFTPADSTLLAGFNLK